MMFIFGRRFHFNEDGSGGGGSSNEASIEMTEVEINGQKVKVPKAYISMKDAEISKAFEKGKTAGESGVNERIAQAVAEATEMAKMSEADKAKKLLENERNQLDQDKAKFALEKKLNDVRAKLLEKKLPDTFAIFFATTEDTDGKIDAFEKTFNEYVSNAVNEKFKGSAPPASSGKQKPDKEVNEFAKRANERDKEFAKMPNPWA